MSETTPPIPPHPIQPIVTDHNGVRRFRANKVVVYLLDHGGLNLNDLARAKADLPREDWEQFHQLIGYSVSGIPSLRLNTQRAADLMESEGVVDWRDARIRALEAYISELRNGVRDLAVQVFGISADELHD